MFFSARFDKWKRHDRIIKILHNLHLKDIRLHLYFAGSVESEIYYQEIKELVGNYSLNDYVHFLGAIKQDDLKVYAYNAIANPLMYDMSNLGNVFFEIFSTGSIVIGLNDGSLNEYLVDGENGFVINNEDEACLVIENLIKNNDITEKIRESAIHCAKLKFLSIDDRFDMEVDLIEQVVAVHKVGR